MSIKRWVVLLGWLLLGCISAHAQTAQRITLEVVDDNGVPVADARVHLTSADGSVSLPCRTSPAGMCTLVLPIAQTYSIRIEREDYYVSETANVHFNPATLSQFTLARQREVREVVNVVESAPAINPEQTSSQEQISGVDVINLPYPATRDYRNALNYIPQVINDVFTQPHITGAETYQTLVLFDGFNVTQPANGQLLLRTSTDSFRSVNVQTSRVSAQYGKSSGGVLELNTATGDDRFRFAATDFIPSLQNKHGWTLDKFNPRLTLSGPIQKGRAWFYEAIDGEYDNIIDTSLPAGGDHDVFWRVGNLVKVQGNLTSRNIVTSSFNVNFAHDQHAGMSLENPPASTPALDVPMYQGSLKDQYTFPSGQLLETGFGFNRYDLDEVPGGSETYFVNPDQTGGSYYFTAHTQADRWQIFSNLFFKPTDWHGNHQFKIGIDLDRLRYDFNFARQPISYLREVGTLPPCNAPPFPCSRYSTFSNPSFGERHSVELSGYAQDRWLVTNRLLVEAGLRLDWDEVLRDALFSPRFAATYVLSQSANTKLSGGIGVFHDATPLFLFARPETGTRTDTFYDSVGVVVAQGITSVFSINQSTLEAPRYLNWSLGIEQKLPEQVYFRAEFLQKRGTNGLAYNWTNPVLLGGGLSNYTAQFQLENGREDRYDAFEINLRRVFEKGHLIQGAYVRSKTHTNQVLDFNVDNPIFFTQQPGPYAWDAPNRFLSWGFLPFNFLPVIHQLDLGFSTEYRTGFPFYVVNNQQQLVPYGGQSAPAFLRFPQYFTLNTHLEKRFHAFGFWWAVRGGFDNITGRKNFGNVNNDVDATCTACANHFLTFSGFSGRAFTGRIRFLGRK